MADRNVSKERKRRDRWRGYWDKHSKSYDREMRFMDRLLFKDSRLWMCFKASGDSLEVGIGTGLNLPFYAMDVQLTGIDLSPAMLRIARTRANELGKSVEFREADAHALPFPDDSFDSVVCTFSLCAIPDDRRALSEMTRVLRPGGRLLLADHIASSNWAVRGLQRVFEVFTVPLQGEHFMRRPLNRLRDPGLEVEERQRFSLGLVERVAASKRTFPTPA
jgi:ubiquinone/menaquinone biosynthesis C-methylase UbiE